MLLLVKCYDIKMVKLSGGSFYRGSSMQLTNKKKIILKDRESKGKNQLNTGPTAAVDKPKFSNGVYYYVHWNYVTIFLQVKLSFRSEYMSPVSPVFHTEVTVSIGLKSKRVGTSIP